MRVSVGDYKTFFQPGTQEGWAMPLPERQGGKEGVEEREEDLHHREEAMRDTFLMNNDGMKGLAKDQVEKKNENFARLCETGSAIGDDEGFGEEDKMDVK